MEEVYIQIGIADQSHKELLESFSEVLEGLKIDCFEDEEEAEKRGCDLFIRLNKREEW